MLKVQGNKRTRPDLAAHNKANARHGLSKTPTWKAWSSMKDRCGVPGDKDWRRYGGRGIGVCERWKDSFEAFLADMGQRPAGTSLDRIDVNGHYEPSNCRWSTPLQQANNRRSNRVIEWQGRRQTVAAWAREMGASRQTLRYRLEAGWPIGLALSLTINYRNGWRNGLRSKRG